MADVGCAAAEAACAVSVVVRVRPLTPHEVAAGARVAWAVDGDRRIHPVGPHVGWRPLGADNSFSFERVYGPDESSERIYEECVRARVAHVLAGYNATVIAFGQTSSGKTTTIHGDARSRARGPRGARAARDSTAGGRVGSRRRGHRGDAARSTVHRTRFCRAAASSPPHSQSHTRSPPAARARAHAASAYRRRHT